MEMGDDFVCDLSEMNKFKYLGSVVQDNSIFLKATSK